jgi:hypothetical protein
MVEPGDETDPLEVRSTASLATALDRRSPRAAVGQYSTRSCCVRRWFAPCRWNRSLLVAIQLHKSTGRASVCCWFVACASFAGRRSLCSGMCQLHCLCSICQALCRLWHAYAALCMLCCSVLPCSMQIAMKELREKKIPFTIRRYLPDGR